jgi:hypothetical protein
MRTKFSLESLKETDYLKDRRRWEGNIKKETNNIWGMDWIHVVWNRGRWRALVNTVMNIGVQ